MTESQTETLTTPTESLEQQLANATSIDEVAEILTVLLSGGYSVWTDESLYHTKQLVTQLDGLKIHIYSKEHPPPHFHVLAADIDASFSIEDCSLIDGSIDGRNRRLVEWWFKRSKGILVNAWNQTRPTHCQVGPIKDDPV